jgi:hypothetical protein
MTKACPPAASVAASSRASPRLAARRCGAKRPLPPQLLSPCRRTTRSSAFHNARLTRVRNVLQRARVPYPTRASLIRCATLPHLKAQASLVAGARSRAAPPASEVNLGGKLRAVCQLFFPARITPRQALKARCHGMKKQPAHSPAGWTRAHADLLRCAPACILGSSFVRADAGPRQPAPRGGDGAHCKRQSGGCHSAPRPLSALTLHTLRLHFTVEH